MKKILTLIALTVVFQSKAQEDLPSMGSIIVNFCKSFNEDCTESSIKNTHYILFLDFDDGIYLTNSRIKLNTKSEGYLYNVKSYKSDEKKTLS